jgi:beta-lactamase class A
MIKIFLLTALLLVLNSFNSQAQSIETLREKLLSIVASNNAQVGIDIISDDGKDTLSINGDKAFPLQSVFKFHIGLYVLSLVDEGKFSLEQEIQIARDELLPGLHSPLREKYPNGANVKLSEILEYTVSQSDNVGCDVLLKMIGGPSVVEKYFKKKGIKDLSIKLNEASMQSTWDLQFQNWTTPRAATQVLSSFYYNEKKLLSEKSHAFIWNLMKGTTTGTKRLKGRLPEGTVVAHKTGTGASNSEGTIGAVNDIGVVFFRNGRFFFISVFVTRSNEDFQKTEQLIAEIGHATWDYFNNKSIDKQ